MMWMSKGMCSIILCLLIGILSIQDAAGSKFKEPGAKVVRAIPPQGAATVYIDENYKGTSESYTLPKWVCVNIDPSFLGYISSIKPTPGTCVRVFTSLGCPESEKGRELKQHTFGTDTLAKIGLNDKISSLKYCDP